MRNCSAFIFSLITAFKHRKFQIEDTAETWFHMVLIWIYAKQLYAFVGNQ